MRHRGLRRRRRRHRLRRRHGHHHDRGHGIIDTHLIVVVDGLPAGASLVDAEGTTADGLPYLRVLLLGGVLLPGNGMPITLRLVRGYTLSLLAGQGDPSQLSSDGRPI